MFRFRNFLLFFEPETFYFIFQKMCRFAIYLGEPVILTDFIIKPSHSIIYQSFDSLERGNGSPLNGDGFGLAW